MSTTNPLQHPQGPALDDTVEAPRIDLAALGHAITDEGLAANESALHALVVAARRLGVVPAATEVLADTATIAPVRERAFAVVARALLAAA